MFRADISVVICSYLIVKGPYKHRGDRNTFLQVEQVFFLCFIVSGKLVCVSR